MPYHQSALCDIPACRNDSRITNSHSCLPWTDWFPSERLPCSEERMT